MAGKATPYNRRFFSMQYDMVDSAAYKSLSVTARALLVEFMRLANPFHNGSLALSEQHAAELLNVSPNTARKAFIELEATGFIVITSLSRYTNGKTYEYRVTCLKAGKQMPTNEWVNWTPDCPYESQRRTGHRKSK